MLFSYMFQKFKLNRQKIKYIFTIQLRNSTTSNLFKRDENICLQKQTQGLSVNACSSIT